MTFLPIVDRELRVAARRKGTYRLRMITALIAVGVTFFFLLTTYLARSRSIGSGLFMALSWYSFALCLLSGVFITADCLSEEKREGTLGFLFLTDLRAYDVVLGKFVAQSLAAFYCLLAVLPVLALPLLMGGVTGGEFWRMALVLVNTLFFSLAVGMLVSAVCRETQAAMSACFLALVLSTGGLALFNGIADSAYSSPKWLLTFGSPAHSFYLASNSSYVIRPERFWYALMGLFLQACFWLGLAVWVLPRMWQDKVVRRSRAIAMSSGKWDEAKQAVRAKRRGQLLDINPVLWLSADNQTWKMAAWVVVGLGVMGWLLVAGVFRAWSSVWTLTGFVLKVMVAIQACRFFVEARRNGALELLLSTPLTGDQVLAGLWQGLRRVFLWPFLVVIVAYTLGLLNMRLDMAGFYGLAIGVMNIAALILDPLAAAWFGMWFALTTKRPAMAAGLTVLYILVLPKLAFCIPDFLIDVVIINRVRSKMKDFRTLALRHYVGDADESKFKANVPPPFRS